MKQYVYNVNMTINYHQRNLLHNNIYDRQETVIKENIFSFHDSHLLHKIDRTSLAEKSARKDEKTLFWPPPITKSTGNKTAQK